MRTITRAHAKLPSSAALTVLQVSKNEPLQSEILSSACG
jgi:hypothetical protein